MVRLSQLPSSASMIPKACTLAGHIFIYLYLFIFVEGGAQLHPSPQNLESLIIGLEIWDLEWYYISLY